MVLAGNVKVGLLIAAAVVFSLAVVFIVVKGYLENVCKLGNNGMMASRALLALAERFAMLDGSMMFTATILLSELLLPFPALFNSLLFVKLRAARLAFFAATSASYLILSRVIANSIPFRFGTLA